MDSKGDILHNLRGKKALVVGLARAGRAAALLLSRLGARVTGCDRQRTLAGTEELKKEGIALHLGNDGPDLLADQELIVLSPGVPLASALCQEARHRGVPLLGEMELGWRLLRRKTRIPLLAVTGTNGKSTVCALCTHLLRKCGKRAALAGNIGNPLCQLLLEEQLPEAVVIEISSFQLEHLSREEALDPQVAVWLNLTPDHLDRHGSMAEYARMKLRLFLGQGKDDHAVLFADDEQIRQAASLVRGRLRWFGRERSRVGPDGIVIEKQALLLPGGEKIGIHNPRLAGEHNAENAAAAALAMLSLGIEPARWREGLQDYPGLPHRIEPVAEIDGVLYIDDSKGTNLDATRKSLTCFERPIVLIAGGRGKGTGYQELRQAVAQRVKQLVLIGEEAERLERELGGCAPAARAASMEEAVRLAARLARPGDVVLLSPACASFDMFNDYHHRGQVFAAAVRSLQEKK